MQLDSKNLCPLLRKPCIKLDCAWFAKISGTDPQDKDRQIDEWGCAIVFSVFGQLEIAKRVSGGLDGVQQATESLRNHVVATSASVGVLEAIRRLPIPENPKEIGS